MLYNDLSIGNKIIKNFAVIGDTQRTMFYQVLMGREVNNDFERRMLFKEIAQRSPEFLLVVGDLVTYGQFDRDWKYFDSVLTPVRDKNIPVLPVIGNHDYFIFTQSALPFMQKRFPRLLKSTWYLERLGELALIALDSNKGPLGKQKWIEQLSWLQETMLNLEQDPTIKGIVFSGHHPPMTNSIEVGPHGPTNESIIPHFLKSKKSLLYLSGHCHSYERFEHQDKIFIVSGGGGGPRQPLRPGFMTRKPDLFKGGMYRPFHYLWLSITPHGLDIEVRGLEKKDSKLHELEKFSLPWKK